MREAGCNHLVFSSTGAFYGKTDSKTVSESYPCEPINPYGASKWDDRAATCGRAGSESWYSAARTVGATGGSDVQPDRPGQENDIDPQAQLVVSTAIWPCLAESRR